LTDKVLLELVQGNSDPRRFAEAIERGSFPIPDQADLGISPASNDA
jgi:hypothetical protein